MLSLISGGSDNDDDSNDKSRLGELSAELDSLLTRLATVNDAMTQLVHNWNNFTILVVHQNSGDLKSGFRMVETKSGY